jgi:hypothetical protein
LVRKKKFGPSGDASASETALYGRDRGKSPARTVVTAKQPVYGPMQDTTVYPGPMGLSFRNIQSFPDNADKLRVIGQMWRFSLTGYFDFAANGSTLPTTSAITWINTHFWPAYYDMLWQLGQRRDGYRSTDPPPLATTTVPRESFEVALKAKVNAANIEALYNSCMVNSGMRSMIEAFDDINPDRIQRAVERANQIYMPQWLLPLANYWVGLYSPYPGGAIIINLFDFQDTEDLLIPGAGAFTAWGDDFPDFNVAADIVALLDDIDLACSQLLPPYNLTAGPPSDLADYKKFISLLDMEGTAGCVVERGTLRVDERRFIEQFKACNAFRTLDTKGAGVDTYVYWPDMEGSEDTLININPCGLQFGPDDLFWIGGKGLYAYEADESATPGYGAAAENLTGLGLFCRVSPTDVVHTFRAKTEQYTDEDGWSTGTEEYDFTSAAGLQSFFWYHPYVSIHPEAWRSIMSEEAEDVRHINFEKPGFQVPVGVFGRAYREWLITQSKLPFMI